MLTAKQKIMLDCLIEHQERHNVSPSFEELCTLLGLKSTSGIHRLLNALEERGYIRRLANKARAIEVLKRPDGSRLMVDSPPSQPESSSQESGDDAVPLLGKIAAGTPIEAISEPQDMLTMPANMLASGKEYYALEVEGDSMIDAGILDGDIVLIERCEVAINGTIVVALIDQEEATLKRLRKKGNSIALEAANPAYEIRIFGPDRVQIQGQLAGLFRRY